MKFPCVSPTPTFIYIYIVIHRQTVSFYQNSSVWLDTQDARSRDRKPIQLYVRLSLRPLAQRWLREFLKYLCSNSRNFRLLTFLYLSATRVLSYFEELYIMRAAADNSFARVRKIIINLRQCYIYKCQKKTKYICIVFIYDIRPTFYVLFFISFFFFFFCETIIRAMLYYNLSSEKYFQIKK